MFLMLRSDVIQTLVEAGYDKDEDILSSETPNYYHPGKSGRVGFLNKGKKEAVAFLEKFILIF